ncbi:hypothetical protein CFAEC_07875 [Corynebacterium faecale]|uniref:hypothetical protein n=1 Tax=Corynebacterium faecale TaxID=1758466 RepID=UPI0025B3A392|nr:hypothetical protein [Corynebacterium faecale]WJY92399.1 hypothetical protein CFAEC_07875 [Corynebacterium faecale]
MKLFSRTSLVAFGTAAAVAASALTAPAFAEDESTTPAATTTVTATTTTSATTPADTTTQESTTVTATRTVTATPTPDASGSSDMDNVNDWIKIITAVIGALTTILTFASNLDRFMAR